MTIKKVSEHEHFERHAKQPKPTSKREERYLLRALRTKDFRELGYDYESDNKLGEEE